MVRGEDRVAVGYVFAIRSERALCREVRVNLANRWFCGMNIADKVSDHSTVTLARNERFLDGTVFRRLFERSLATCVAAGLVGGKGSAVDASPIAVDANKSRSTPDGEWSHDIDPETVDRPVPYKICLANLDDPAWGAATNVIPKFAAHPKT